MNKDQAMIHTLMKENDELKLEIGRLRNNSIIIPENATNGDMIKALFPNVEIQTNEEYGKITNLIFIKIYGNETHCYKWDWWNKSYKIE